MLYASLVESSEKSPFLLGRLWERNDYLLTESIEKALIWLDLGANRGSKIILQAKAFNVAYRGQPAGVEYRATRTAKQLYF